MRLRLESRQKDGKWHRWFAWRPVLAMHGENTLVWLEWVERRVPIEGGLWWYRSLEGEE